jgi:malonyl-CoA/methylmalonyl-CoA synthetase
VPHADFGESVAVAVVTNPGVTLSAAQIMEAIGPGLAKFKHPRHIHFVEALPRNTMGKVQKNQLRDTFAKADA